MLGVKVHGQAFWGNFSGIMTFNFVAISKPIDLYSAVVHITKKQNKIIKVSILKTVNVRETINCLE